MLAPKTHANQAIDTLCEALNYLDNAIYNEPAIMLPASVMQIEGLPKAFYIYAWHLQILDRVLHRMEKHSRNLYGPQGIQKKHVAIHQLSEVLQGRYLQILAQCVLARSQEVYECLIDTKDDAELSQELYNSLNGTRDAAEILINLLRDCLEKDKGNEEMSQKLNKCLKKAESAKETLWYPNRYLKDIDNRVILPKLYECLELNADIEALLLGLQRQYNLPGHGWHDPSGYHRDNFSRHPRLNRLGIQRENIPEYQRDDPRGYRLRQERSGNLDLGKRDICLKKATDVREVLRKLCLYLQYNNEGGEISQMLDQCHERAKGAFEMLSRLRLENDRLGKASRKLCLEKIRITGHTLLKLYEFLKKDYHRGEVEDVLCICLYKAHNGRKSLQELHRCFGKEKESEKILQELSGCPEENDDGEDGEEISQSLSKCLEKTKAAGGMLLEVLRDCFKDKQDERYMLPELLHDDDGKYRRGWKTSQKPASQQLNQKLNRCLDEVKDAGEMLRELCEYLKENGGELEDDVNYLVGKIFMASITCSPDEDVKMLRDTLIQMNLIKPSREEGPGKLSAQMTTESDCAVEISCAIASLLSNSNPINANDKMPRPFRDRLHHGNPQVCSVYRLGCKEHFCALPTGHTRLHEFSGPCNANCNRNWDFSTDSRLPGLFPQRLSHQRLKVSSTYQLGCDEDRCTSPLGHTSPHKFPSRCSAGCILSSVHSGAHLFPHTLSTDTDRMHKKSIKMKEAAVKLVDKAICTSLLDQSTASATLPGALAGQSSDEEKNAMMDEAARSGRTGVKSSEHGMHMDEEVADLILEKDAVFVATQHIDRLLAQDGDQLPPQKDIRAKLAVNTAGTKAINGPYLNLDMSKKQIRLFELYPSTNASEIKGSFHCVKSSAHEYIALSYTWGNEAPCREIQVDGEKLSIRENLWWFLGLQSISISEANFFWIDAICINQSNIKERNHQVGLMSQIYTNASAVYIWLGRESNDSDLAMEYITRQASKELKTEGMRYRPLWSQQEGRALVELCERPYWRRMWIIQEVISARNIIAFCGTKRFDWGCLTKLYQKLKVLESTNWLAHHPFALAVFQSSASAIIWQRAYWRHPIIPTPSLKKLISVFSSWQCTDLRDKVYALVGMASPETAVVPDYSRTTYQICQDIWAQDAHKDAQYYEMLIRVLELSRDP